MFKLAGPILILVLAAGISPDLLAVQSHPPARIIAADVALEVDEAASRVYLKRKPAKVDLVVVSRADDSIPARVTLEVVDPTGAVRGSAQVAASLERGRSVITSDIDLTSYTETGPGCEGFYAARLQYQIVPRATDGSVPSAPMLPVSGQIAFPRIAPDLFAVQVVASPFHKAAGKYVVYLNAYTPVTGEPKSGAELLGSLQVDSGSDGDGADNSHTKLSATGRTDANGQGLLEFAVPASWIGREADLTVLATDGELKFDVEATISPGSRAWTLISTDKPLYQPGQKVHLRLLVIEYTSRKPFAGAEVQLKVLDPEDMLLHAVALKTSRFGVASTDWTVPETARLGEYTIEASLPELDPDDDWDAWTSRQTVRITRYDLPNFTVQATPDRSFYLPGQNALLKVEASYLFGKPVPESHVRVVKESDREWNYREQKWELDERESFEGETDASGSFSLPIDLKEKHEALSKRQFAEYDDETYSVYVTDRSTGKTEQRRVDLRLTKQPLHLRVGYDQQPQRLPWEFHVTAFYPDGKPASCPVDVEVFAHAPADGDQPVARVRVTTNRFGLARVTGLRVPPNKDRSGRGYTVRLTATAPGGVAARSDEGIWVSDHPVIRISTASNIQKPGQPLQVEIESDLPDTDLNVSVWANRELVHSDRTRLVAGHAALNFSYREKMTRDVTITAFSFEHSEALRYGGGPIGAKVVVYPGEPDTRLEVRTDRAQYRPGEEARAEFRVLQRNGAPATEFILGVVAIDRAVEERARTIQEFEMPRSRFHGLAFPDYESREFSGITLDTLLALTPEQVDPDYDLLAGLLISSNVTLDGLGETLVSSADTAFAPFFRTQFDLVGKKLDDTYGRLRLYPRDEASLHGQITSANIALRALRDPWGKVYRYKFAAVGSEEGFQVWTDGPDEEAGSDDDFKVFERRWPYFQKYGEMMDRAQVEYYKRTGRFIREAGTLKAELRRHGVDFDALRDPWGNPYQLEFGVDRAHFTITVCRRDATAPHPVLWRSRINYWLDTEAKVKVALVDGQARTGRYPDNADEFFRTLKRAGISRRSLVDGWGNPLQPLFTREWRYTDKFVVRSVSSFGEPARTREDVVPTNQVLGHWRLMSRGPDGLEGTVDDFVLGNWSNVLSETAVDLKGESNVPAANAKGQAAVAKVPPALVSGTTGAISGVIKDPMGGVIPGAEVTVVDERTAKLFRAVTSDEGLYAVSDLPIGFYTVQVDMPGFRSSVTNAVPVHASTITRLDVSLEVGSVSETVMVSASVPQISTSSAEKSEVIVEKRGVGQTDATAPLFTPRVRQYFPETLLWYPELEVGKDGRAEVTFQLPDSLTAWKTSVIATSLNGDSAYQELEFETFQPFFLEPDPPQVLTAGDRIHLPVVVRNYLDTAQEVALEIEPGEGLEIEGPRQTKARTPAQESLPVYFPLRAVHPTPVSEPKVTGIAGNVGDAIVKRLEIRPDGREETFAEGRLLSDSSAWSFQIPTHAMPGTARGELRIYPDVGSHIIDAIAGIRANPNGCPEQIISSTYPSVLLLQYERAGGRLSAAVKQRAVRDLGLSCLKLSSFSLAGGGFAYWRDGEPNLALTAYALRFMMAARDFTAIDEELIHRTARALLARQVGDGHWPAHRYGKEDQEDIRQSISLTAWITRILAELKDAKGVFPPVLPADSKQGRTIHTCLENAGTYLGRTWDRTSDPYVVALYGQAALRLGKAEEAERAVKRLLELAKREGTTAYWTLETNSVFWGWGRAGRLETTALVVQTLSAAREVKPTLAVDPEEIRRWRDGGAQFLLRSKDPWGVWLTGQATVLALEALVGLLPPVTGSAEGGNRIGQLQVRLNGRLIEPARDMSDETSGGPLRFDLSPHLRRGSNDLRLVSHQGASTPLALLSSSWYEPWSLARSVDSEVNSNTRLGLEVSFDRNAAVRGENIECKVTVERIGFSGYGMLLAEVGLPPGVDVDRASLEAARDVAGWALASYEVLPDRIVMYLWPRAGGIHFAFKFKPRIGMVAKSVRSVLYDYYNPDLRVVLAPPVFQVRGQ